MSTAKTLAKGTFWGVAATVFLKFVGWFYMIAVTRLFSKDDIGIFFWVFSVVSIVVIFSDLGLGPSAVARFVPYHAGKEEYNHVRRVLKTSLLAGTIASLLCMIALIFFSNDIIVALNRTELSSKIMPVFVILSLYLLLYNFYSIFASFLVGRKLIKKVSYMTSIQGFSKFVLTIILLFFIGTNSLTLSIGFILSFLIASATGWYWTIKEYRRLPITTEHVDNYKLLKDMTSFGLVVTLLMTLGTVISSSDKVMIGFLLPADESMKLVAVYSASLALSTFISIVPSSINSIFFPVITEFLGKKDYAGIEKTSSTCIRWIALSTPPAMIVIAVYAKDILSIVYGQGYSDGATALIYYSFGLFIMTYVAPVQNILTAMNRQMTIVKITVIGTLINVALNYLLIPTYKMDGAAFASAFSLIVMTLLFLRIRKTVHVSIPRSIYKPLTAGCITLVALYLFRLLLGDITLAIGDTQANGIVSDIIRKLMKAGLIGILIMITCFLYFILLLLFSAFEREDAEVVSGGLNRMKVPQGVISRIEKIMLGRAA